MRYLAGLLGGAVLLLCSAGAQDSWAQTDEISEDRAQRLRELLRNQGYSEIEFVDRDGDTLTANACSENRGYRVTLNRNGRVLERAESGPCVPVESQQAVSDEIIIDTLYGRGYLRVDIVDRTPPTLLANACRGDRKFQVRMDNEGDILDVKEDGACNLAEGEPLDLAQIERILSLQGYRSIRMPLSQDAPYRVTACNGVRQFELQVTAAAQVNRREASGFCTGEDVVEYLPPRPVEEIRLAGTDALEPEGCQMVLDWLQYEHPLTFAKESAELSNEDMNVINQIAAAAARCPTARILVEGHTSQTGGDAFNQDLSEKRALAVQQALRDAGIGEDRLAARGFGEAYPRIPNDANATLNRRIEINLEWDMTEI